MSESVKRLKANKVIAGGRCGSCRNELALGEDAAICRECRLLHHGVCWDKQGGCARSGCVNAPLKQIETAWAGEGGEAPPPGKILCPQCGKQITRNVLECPFCRGPVRDTTTPRRRFPSRDADKASISMGTVDWIFCLLCPGIGCILGIVALIRGETRRGGYMILVALVSSLVVSLLRLIGEWNLR